MEQKSAWHVALYSESVEERLQCFGAGKRNRRTKSGAHTSSKAYGNSLRAQGGKWDWDDFISIPAGYPELEAVQKFCLSISDEYPPTKGVGWCNEEGIRELKRKLDELE